VQDQHSLTHRTEFFRPAKMTSLYDIAIPPFINGLKNTAGFLTKAINQAEADGVDKQTYLTSRLHPTMADLPKQIHFITSTAKAVPYHLNTELTQLELPEAVDTTFPEMLARLKKTYEYLESIKREDIDGREAREVVIELGVQQRRLTPIAFLLDVWQPNFWFHVSMAYGILRKEGVTLFKGDYLRGAQLTKTE
jgi:hypothetical protein